MNKKCDDCGKALNDDTIKQGDDVYLIDHMVYCKACFKGRGGVKGTKQFECPGCGLIFDEDEQQCDPADGCSCHGPTDIPTD